MDDAWVELVPGVPGQLDDGRLVTCADRDGADRLLVDGEPVTPPDLQVRSVAAILGSGAFVYRAIKNRNAADLPTISGWQAA